MPETTNIDTLYAVATGRKMFLQNDLDTYEKHNVMGVAQSGVTIDEANLVSSEVRPGVHMPVIDCDYGIQAIASTTLGHYHLYIDRELTWEQYRALLHGFKAAGLIEEAWYHTALKDKRSYVRLPHIKKKPPARDEELDIPEIPLPF
jgi:hypothetical protein